MTVVLDRERRIQPRRLERLGDDRVVVLAALVVDAARRERITASLPTLRYALEKGAAVMVTSHLGRPKEGSWSEADSLAPVAARLSELLGIDVPPAQLMAGLFGHGLRSLGAAGAPVDATGYTASALTGGGVVFALALVLPGLVYLRGACTVYFALVESSRPAPHVPAPVPSHPS